MRELNHLFESNKNWAEAIKAEDPLFFQKLSQQQNPEYLWIGCSDSRVPANQIVDLMPGDLFVHRNIANCVVHTDLNCLSVIYYAIKVLKVKHIIVCGHYGCGGIEAALSKEHFGLADQWIRNVRDVYFNQQSQFSGKESEQEKSDKLCELNVLHQMQNVSRIPEVQNVWSEGQPLSIHGWIYSMADGMLKQLATSISSIEQVALEYQIEKPA